MSHVWKVCILYTSANTVGTGSMMVHFLDTLGKQQQYEASETFLT